MSELEIAKKKILDTIQAEIDNKNKVLEDRNKVLLNEISVLEKEKAHIIKRFKQAEDMDKGIVPKPLGKPGRKSLA
jgi:hypothetical protein